MYTFSVIIVQYIMYLIGIVTLTDKHTYMYVLLKCCACTCMCVSSSLVHFCSPPGRYCV